MSHPASTDRHASIKEADAKPPPAASAAGVPAGKVLSIEGASLYCVDSGGPGEVILLMHPQTGSTAIWQHQWQALASAGYRVIAYSRRGHWGSSPIDVNSPGTGAQDLKSLLDSLGIQTFHGVGVAGGGYYLMDFAVKWGAMLQSMVLACSVMGIAEKEFLDLFTRNAPPKLRELPKSFVELGPAYRSADTEGTEKWEALERTARHDENLAQPKLHGVSWREVETVSVPTMLICGGADLYVTPTMVNLAAAHLSASEVRVMPNIGHSPHWEDPRSFNSLVLQFVAQHRADGASPR